MKTLVQPFAPQCTLLLACCLRAGCWAAGEQPPRSEGTPDFTEAASAVVPLGPPDTLLGEIRDIAVANGTVWVAARGEVPLARYSLDGAEPTYPITLGSGPEQVRELLSLDVDRDGAVVAWDGRLGRIITVSPTGSLTVQHAGQEFSQILSVPRFDYLGGRRNRVAVMDGGLIRATLDTSRWGTTDFARAQLLQQTPSGWKVVLDFGETARWIESTLGDNQRFGAFPLWQRCGRDRVAVYTPHDNVITLYDADWRIAARMEATTQPYQRTDSLARGLFYRRLLWSADGRLPDAQLTAFVLGAPTDALKEAAAILPSYTEMLCTEDGTVLLQHLDATMRSGPPSGAWEAYKAGQPVRRFTLPDRFRAMQVSDTLLVGYQLDSLDVPAIAVVRLPVD